ncbi:MAG: glycoside hydrolase family 78 protein [Planctomycetaceae bacterium]|nr:glycoside hydrolase family 78 protein [Planctomycetaceae bacterium]
MTRKHFLLLRWAILALLVFGNVSVFADTTITRTRVNRRVEPVGLETATPMLSWNLIDSVRNTSQKAYRIRVAGSPERLAEDRDNTDSADLWDTGWVESNEMIEIEYAGKPLAPSTKYWWTVSVRNNRDETSTLAQPATFVTGLFDDTDWKAQWISMSRTDKEPMPIFRKSFSSGKSVRGAFVHVCGLGHYELRLNGAKVGNSFIDPGWTNYRKTCLYGSYDVTNLLRDGENVFGVMLGNGMYNVPGGRYVKFTGTFGPPKLIAQLEIFYDDGTHETIATDETWRCTFGPIVFSCVYGGEDFDATRIEAGWDCPNFDDANWQAVQVVAGPGGVLRAQEAPPITVAETLQPESVQRLENGQYIADFGYNFSGRPRILLRGKPGSKVTVKTGELVDRIWEGHSYTYTLAGTGRNLPLETQSDVLSDVPNGDETIELLLPKFTYFGFQFLRIEGAVQDSDRTDADSDLPTLVAVMADFTTSSAEQVGTFRCSNAMVNEIDKMIERSVRSNLQSVLTDCPHREKLGWLEVSHLMGPSIMSRFDVQNLYRKICRDTTESQLENGLVPDIAPEYTRFQDGFFESPEWGSASVLLPHQLFHTYSDRQIVRQQMPTMERYVDYLASTRNEQGLVKAGLGDWYDWSPEKGHAGYSQHTPGELTATMMLYLVAKVLDEHIEWKNEDGNRNPKWLFYSELADQVEEDFSKAYQKPDGIIATGSQAAQALSIVGFDMYRFDFDVAEQLIKKLAETNNRPTVGEVAFPYLLRALDWLDAWYDSDDIIWDIITGTEKPGYGYMLKHCGMKTLSETWDGPGSSMNHCMFGHAQEWFMKSIAGINIDENVIKHYATGRIDVRPMPCDGSEGVMLPAIYDGYHIIPTVVGDLTSAEGTYLSPFGQVECAWRIENERFKCRVTIPANLYANVTLPIVGDAERSTLDGKPLKDHSDLRYCSLFDERIDILIGSGTYNFETDWKPIHATNSP